MPSPIVSDQLGLAPRGKDRSKGCLWLLAVLALLVGLYGIQLRVVANRYAAPVETQDLGHGITLEIWEQRTPLESVPLLGLWMRHPGDECILIVKQDGAECYREYFYPLKDASPRAQPGNLVQHNGKIVLQIQLDYAQTFWLDLPAPADLPPLPSPTATTPQAP